MTNRKSEFAVPYPYFQVLDVTPEDITNQKTDFTSYGVYANQ